MPKGARRTPEQKLAAAETAAAKARAEMDKQMAKYGYILHHAAKALPDKDKRFLRDKLGSVTKDKGDIARLDALLGPEAG